MIRMRMNQRIMSVEEACDKATVSEQSGLCRGSSRAFWSIFSRSFGSCQCKKDPGQKIWSWHEQKECKSSLNGFCNSVWVHAPRLSLKCTLVQRSGNLFTAASISKAQSKTYLFSTNSKRKDKNSLLVFVEYIYLWELSTCWW